MGYQQRLGTDDTDEVRNSQKNVETLNAFPDPVGGVITFVNNTTYYVTRPINTGNLRFEWPPGGNVKLTTSSEFPNSWTTELTGDQPLFSGDIARAVLQDIDFISVNNARLHDFVSLTAALPNFIHQRSLVFNFSSIGTVSGILSVSNNVAYVNCGAGIIFEDNDEIIVWKDFNFINQKGNHITLKGNIGDTLFKIGKGVPFTGDAIYNLAYDSIKSLEISSILFDDTNGGTFFDPTGKDQTEKEVIIHHNLLTPDSTWTASTQFTGGTTETILSDTSTAVKLAGTYIDGDLERFTVSNGVITYIGLEPIKPIVLASAAIKLVPSIETDVIQIAVYKNGTEIITTRKQQTLGSVFQTPTSPPFDLSDNIKLVTNDTLELRMTNLSKPANVIATDAKIVVKD